MRTYEGVIEIPLEEYVEFVRGFLPNPKDNVIIGPPRASRNNETIEVSFAGTSSVDSPPAEWGIPPKAKLEWDCIK
jgi:hypothetical protein